MDLDEFSAFATKQGIGGNRTLLMVEIARLAAVTELLILKGLLNPNEVENLTNLKLSELSKDLQVGKMFHLPKSNEPQS